MRDEKEKNEETSPKRGPGKLPPIRVDNEVGDGEPCIEVGKRKASLPPPVLFNPREK